MGKSLNERGQTHLISQYYTCVVENRAQDQKDSTEIALV